MRNVLRNMFALLRGNIVCFFTKLWHKGSRYSVITRMQKWAELNVDRGGRFVFGRDVAIGKRCICTVRKGALLHFGNGVSLNSDCKIVCHNHVAIGAETIFGPNVLIYDHDHVFDTEHGVRRKEFKDGEVVIGDNCWIGAGAIILRGTHIGDNCVVGAGSVVKGTYESGTRIIQKRTLIGEP